MSEDRATASKAAKTTGKRVNMLLCSVLAAYLLSYCVLSLLGNYSQFLSRSGAIRYKSGLSAADIREWEPCGVIKYAGRYNFLGALYAPLVDIDRWIWHKPMQIITFESR